MSILELRNLKSALVVGSIYSDDFSKLEKLSNFLQDYDVIVLNVNIFHPFDENKILKTISAIDSLTSTGKIIYNIAGLDLKNSLEDKRIRAWLDKQNNVINLIFERGTSYFIIDGGLNENIIKKQELNDNMEVSFINDKNWHEDYTGNIGYIICNKPYYDKPKFFNYSCSIGCKYGKNKVFAQEIYENGLGKTIII